MILTIALSKQIVIVIYKELHLTNCFHSDAEYRKKQSLQTRLRILPRELHQHQNNL